MINFFRKIRRRLADDNKPVKYFRYAIGEIVLVVIGILIALQVNNWNQDRISQLNAKYYFNSLIQDLEEDIAMIEDILYQTNEIVERIDSLSHYVKNKNIEEISNLDLLILTLNKPHRPYTWNRTTIDDMKSSGSFANIKDETLSKKIAKYAAFTHHLDEDYFNDKAQFEKATELISLVVNNNYSNFDEIHHKLLPINNFRDFDFFKSLEYRNGKKENLDLLTDDIIDIHKAVNSFNVLKSYLMIRTQNELPILIDDAQGLIVLLK